MISEFAPRMTSLRNLRQKQNLSRDRNASSYEVAPNCLINLPNQGIKMWSLIQDSISWLLDHSEEEENFDEQLLFEKEEEEILFRVR